MAKLSNLILSFAFLLIFSPGKAQSDTADLHSKNSIEVRSDIEKELTESKLDLEKIYNETLEFLDSVETSDADSYKAYLIQSQNGWIKYCEGKCRITEYQSRGGAQGGLAFYSLCMTDLNKKRTAELKDLLLEWKAEFDN